MKRPLAYITAAWCGSDCENAKQAAQYCRAVYDAGFSPICPTLYQPLFLNDAIPEEHKSGIDMGRDLLRRSHVLVVCGSTVTEAMKNDIAVEAVIDSGEHTSSVADLINLTENLDCFEFYSDVHSDEELGRMYVLEFGGVEVPEHLIDYIDYEAYGRDVRINESVHFAPGG